MRLHTISCAAFDALASCDPDPGTVRFLRQVRLSRTLLLLRQIASAHPTPDLPIRALTQAQSAAPDGVADILTYPWIGVWAARCVRLGKPVDQAYLANVAAAAALRAGVPREAHDLLGMKGRIVLPTIGILRRIEGGRRLDDLEMGSLTRIRVVRPAGDQGPTITVDDLDPYRDCHGIPVSGRLSAEAWRSWPASMAEAWSLLEGYAPLRAAEMTLGLRSVVPLHPDEKLSGLSVTHADAFGGFAASTPRDPSDLAAAMVHEFQHSKVNTLLDLVPLHGETDSVRYFAPWRPDPRPLAGMLHGITAFMAVASFWHSLWDAPDLGRKATVQFARVRAQLIRAFAEISSAPDLTPNGARFVRGLEAALARLLAHSVPRSDERAAHADVVSAEARWRRRWRSG